MKKDIKDYLHLYLPFEFMWHTDAVPFHKGERGIMEAHDLRYWDEHKKIILRLLSDMTKGEEKEWLDACHDTLQKYPAHTYECNKAICDGHSTKWLLSKGFDLFGLIEAGLAIDSTTLKDEKAREQR